MKCCMGNVLNVVCVYVLNVVRGNVICVTFCKSYQTFQIYTSQRNQMVSHQDDLLDVSLYVGSTAGILHLV